LQISSSVGLLCAKNYENWLAVDKVIAKIGRLTFWPTLYIRQIKRRGKEKGGRKGGEYYLLNIR